MDNINDFNIAMYQLCRLKSHTNPIIKPYNLFNYIGFFIRIANDYVVLLIISGSGGFECHLKYGVAQFDAKPAEIRAMLDHRLNPIERQNCGT